MSIKFQPLPTIPHEDKNLKFNRYRFPELVHDTDPASDIMIDFTRTPPVTVRPENTFDSLLQLVQSKHHDVLLVIDDEQQLAGLISASYLLSSKPIRYMTNNQLHHDQVTATMIMTAVDHILQIDRKLLTHAKIGNIIQTLCQAQKNYALVTTNDSKHSRLIDGIFALPVINKHMMDEVSIEKWSHHTSNVSKLQRDDMD